MLERILETPHLARAVPRLPAQMLHRVIESCGLEDAGPLIALATPGQIAAIFDLDLWRAERPGVDEAFDPERFAIWMSVLLESGADHAARTLAAIDAGVIMAALAQHVSVFDPAGITYGVNDDGDELMHSTLDAGASCEIGGYIVVARRSDGWDAMVDVLAALDAQAPDFFHRVMGGCRRLSNGDRELDELDDLLSDADQVAFDRAYEREQRREQQGYASPAQARAFLQAARSRSLGPDSVAPAMSPIAEAYFRALKSDAAEVESSAAPDLDAPSEAESVAAVTAVVDVLVDAGIVVPQPRALLEGGRDQPARLAHIQRLITFAGEHDQAAYFSRSGELAYLANVLAAGCSIQARSFTAQEASDAVLATCNLGLENWPAHWRSADAVSGEAAAAPLPAGFLIDHDLIGVFEVGWTSLYRQVCMVAAERLIDVLQQRRSRDADTQEELNELRQMLITQVRNGTPWHARDAFDVLSTLDLPAWATLLGLVDECPTMHAAIAASQGKKVHSVSSTTFDFIAENRQIAEVQAFLVQLPELLRG